MKGEIKIEKVEDDEGFAEGEPLSFSVPRPIEGLHEVGPPPFLMKTFEIVEDPVPFSCGARRGTASSSGTSTASLRPCSLRTSSTTISLASFVSSTPMDFGKLIPTDGNSQTSASSEGRGIY